MGRSLLISIPSTTSPCITPCNMTKTLLFVLLGLVAMALSENLEGDQGNEIEETLDEIELDNIEELQEDEDESLDASRMKRDADPKKKRKGKKAKKAGRKGKKRGRKNAKKGARKNKGKGKNKAKKSRKFGRKNKKARKQRKQVRRGKKPRKTRPVQQSGTGRLACSRAVNSTCLDTAVKLLKIVSSRITNFLVQQKRMSKFNSTGGKKSDKKGLFGPIASKVIDIGGGNASDLSCSGNKTSEGAMTIKEIIANLSKCEEDIKSACDISAYPIPNKTEAEACVSNMESMKKSVDACTKKSGSEACSCWLDSSLMATAEKVKPCNIATENKRVTSQHKRCTSTFSA